MPGDMTTLDDKRAIRKCIAQLEEQMTGHKDSVPLYDLAEHDFADGVYSRKLFMPAGMAVVSMIHKIDSFCFVMYGEAIVIDEGIGTHKVVGPCMIKTKAGTKRALRILTDSLWIGVYPNPDEERDIEAIRERIISPVHLDKLLEQDGE